MMQVINEYAQEKFKIMLQVQTLLFDAHRHPEKLNQALGIIGRGLETERFYIYEFHSYGLCTNTYEWCLDKVSLQLNEQQEVNLLEILPRWLAAFQKKTGIIINNLEELHSINLEEYEYLHSQAIKNLIAFPLHDYTGKMLGFIGANNLADPELAELLLKTLALNLATFLVNRRVYQELNEKQYRVYSEILEKIGDSYISILHVNLEDNTYIMGKSSRFPANNFQTQSNYDLRLEEFIEQFIYSEEQELAREFLSRKQMNYLLNPSSQVKCIEVRQLIGGKYRWSRIRILPTTFFKGRTKEVIITLRDIEEEKSKEFLLLAQRREREHIQRIAAALSRNCFDIYYFDLSLGVCQSFLLVGNHFELRPLSEKSHNDFEIALPKYQEHLKELHQEDYLRNISQSGVHNIEYVYETKRIGYSESRWVRLNIALLKETSNELTAAVYGFTDITEQKQAEIEAEQEIKKHTAEIEQLYNQIMHVGSLMYRMQLVVDIDTMDCQLIVFEEDSHFQTITRGRYEDMMPLICGRIPEPDKSKIMAIGVDYVRSRFQSGVKEECFEYPIIMDDGQKRLMKTTIFYDNHNERNSLLVIVRDVTKEVAAYHKELEYQKKLIQSANEIRESCLREARLREATETDSLTQMKNEKAFKAAVKLRIERLEDDNDGSIFIVIDGDEFKAINDNYGHLVGDEMIKLVGNTIQQRIRFYDIAARLHGDEFAVYLEGISNYEIAGKVIDDINQMLLENARRLNKPKITISAGFALVKAGSSYEEVFERADMALYKAKFGHKKGQYCY